MLVEGPQALSLALGRVDLREVGLLAGEGAHRVGQIAQERSEQGVRTYFWAEPAPGTRLELTLNVGSRQLEPLRGG